MWLSGTAGAHFQLIFSKRQSMKLTEGGELFLEMISFEAECMVATNSLLDTGQKLLLNSN